MEHDENEIEKPIENPFEPKPSQLIDPMPTSDVMDNDDVYIDCKIDYQIKKPSSQNEDNHNQTSSISSLNSSDDETEEEELGKQQNSDYDNLTNLNMSHNKQVTSSTTAILSTSHNESLVSLSEDTLQTTAPPVTLNGALSTSANSINSTSSSTSSSSSTNNFNQSNLNNDPFNASDYLNKSYDEDDAVEYNFVEDFTDLSKELDDNWIQEDELWFNSLVSTSKPTMNSNNPFLVGTIHPPRILHRIEEESSVCSESESNLDAKEVQDVKER
jgi:hypothetical protein